MAVSASWEARLLTASVVFDKPLTDQPIARSNWSLTDRSGLTRVPDAASVAVPAGVRLRFSEEIELPATVEYFASPPDVKGAPPNDLEVEPFVIPIT